MFNKLKSIIIAFVLIAILSTSTQAFALFSASSIVSLTNDQRSSNDVASLSTNQALTNAALAKANDMLAKGYFAHTSPDGKTPWDFIHQAGYNYTYAGENLAINYDNASELMTAWMNSPTHRENILSPNFSEIGVAVATGSFNGSEAIIVVQEFGSPIGASVQSAQTSNAQAEATPTSTAASANFDIVQDKSRFSPTSIFASEKVDFSVTISGEIKTLVLTVGSSTTDLLATKDIVTSGKEKTYTLSKQIDELGTQKVTVTATDAAGNQKSAELGQLEVKPTVLGNTNTTDKSTNRTLFSGFHSTTSLVGAIILAGVIVCAGVYLVLRRNKFRKLARTALASWEF